MRRTPTADMFYQLNLSYRGLRKTAEVRRRAAIEKQAGLVGGTLNVAGKLARGASKVTDVVVSKPLHWGASRVAAPMVSGVGRFGAKAVGKTLKGLGRSVVKYPFAAGGLGVIGYVIPRGVGTAAEKLIGARAGVGREVRNLFQRGGLPGGW